MSAKRVQGSEMLRPRGRCVGIRSEGREDLDAFDRVDSQVGVEGHVQTEHVGGIASLSATTASRTALNREPALRASAAAVLLSRPEGGGRCNGASAHECRRRDGRRGNDHRWQWLASQQRLLLSHQHLQGGQCSVLIIQELLVQLRRLLLHLLKGEEALLRDAQSAGLIRGLGGFIG